MPRQPLFLLWANWATLRCGLRAVNGQDLEVRVDAAIHDLSNVWPRPVLGGRTAREVYDTHKRKLPDRWRLIKEVDAREKRLRQEARNRADLDKARRRAIESVLLSRGLMKYGPDVVTDFSAQRVTV